MHRSSKTLDQNRQHGLVIDVSWRFLGIAVPSQNRQEIEGELRELRKVLYFRENAYRFAWALAALAMILMFIDAILFVIARFESAT
jgi:hypothetical protein